MVSTKTEAEAFAKTLRYPPEGTRGMSSSCRAASYGLNFGEYLKGAGAAPIGIAQIETPLAVTNKGQSSLEAKGGSSRWVPTSNRLKVFSQLC